VGRVCLGVGGGGRLSLKVLKVEVKVIFSVFWRYLSITIRLQMIRERSERRKFEKI